MRVMPLYLKNPDWYYEDEEGIYRVKNNAPDEVKRSYVDFHKDDDCCPDSKAGIIGLAIGDAMGVPLEFFKREVFVENPVTEMMGNASHNMPKGSWSDDTSLNIALVDSINKNNGEINFKDIGERFVMWMFEGEYTPTGETFGIGRRCLQSISRIKEGKLNPEECGGTGKFDNGNGSLMRILPIAYYCFSKWDYKEDDHEIYDVVKKVSSLTHAHEISIMACYIYVKFAIELFYGKDLKQAYTYIQSLDYKYFSEDCKSNFKRILNNNIYEYNSDEISSLGYVVDTLEATLWTLLTTDNYDSAIIKAINLGNDADTVGACVGGLAGIFYGFDTINDTWKKDLIKYEYLADLCNTFNDVLFYSYICR